MYGWDSIPQSTTVKTDKSEITEAPEAGPSEEATSSLAYENHAFLNSRDGRVLRIIAEYSEPLSRFRRERIQDTVVFFGSARFASRETSEGALQLLEKPGSAAPAPPEEQEKLRRAHAAVNMARRDEANDRFWWPGDLEKSLAPLLRDYFPSEYREQLIGDG